MTPRPDTSPTFFERLYRNAEDPWNFRGSGYERKRYAEIVAWVDDRRYQSAFEPGCAIGELTAMLAPLCRSLKAMDFSASAVSRARSRCRNFPQVQVYQGALPDDIPGEPCDLIVFSEIGYYFPFPELERLSTRLWSTLLPGGRMVACHWLGHSGDHELHGSQVREVMLKTFGPPDRENNPADGYTLQRWTKPAL